MSLSLASKFVEWPKGIEWLRPDINLCKQRCVPNELQQAALNSGMAVNGNQETLEYSRGQGVLFALQRWINWFALDHQSKSSIAMALLGLWWVTRTNPKNRFTWFELPEFTVDVICRDLCTCARCWKACAELYQTNLELTTPFGVIHLYV